MPSITFRTKVLQHPKRAKIMSLLPCTFNDLIEVDGLHEDDFAQHLAIMHTAGLIHVQQPITALSTITKL